MTEDDPQSEAAGLDPLTIVEAVALGLALFKSEYLVEWNLIMAAATLMLLPILVLFFFAQRYFVQGIVMAGIKG